LLESLPFLESVGGNDHPGNMAVSFEEEIRPEWDPDGNLALTEFRQVSSLCLQIQDNIRGRRRLQLSAVSRGEEDIGEDVLIHPWRPSSSSAPSKCLSQLRRRCRRLKRLCILADDEDLATYAKELVGLRGEALLLLLSRLLLEKFCGLKATFSPLQLRSWTLT